MRLQDRINRFMVDLRCKTLIIPSCIEIEEKALIYIGFYPKRYVGFYADLYLFSLGLIEYIGLVQ